MKREIHPKLHKTKVVLADGREFDIMLSKELKPVLKLEVDPSNHPAWNKDKVSDRSFFGEVGKFKSKFDLDI